MQGEAARYATAHDLRAAWVLDAPMLTLPEAAAQLREPVEAPRLVTGSLYLLGDLLRELGIRPYLGPVSK